jgi:predicted HicB family RNase H-like nuclease
MAVSMYAARALLHCLNFLDNMTATNDINGGNMRESQTRAKRKYDKNHYDHLHIIVKKGKREEIKKAAALQDKTLNGYVIEAIDDKMNGDA